MNRRPNCDIPDCKNGALIYVYSKYICGECYFKIHQEQEKKKWEELTLSLNK